MEGGQRRLTLWDQMSAVDGGSAREALAGLTLKDVLASPAEKRDALPPPPGASVLQSQPSNPTLMDVIRLQDANAMASYKSLIESQQQHSDRDKKAWRSFKDRLRLKRAGAAWTSSVRIPASDIPIQNTNVSDNNGRSLSLSRRNSVRFQFSAEATQSGEDPSCSSSSSGQGLRPQMSRRSSTRFGQLLNTIPFESDEELDSFDAALPRATSLRPQISRHNSTCFQSAQLQDSMNNRVAVNDTAANEDEDEEQEEDTSQHAPMRRLSVVLEEARALSAREAVAAQEAAEAAAAAERESHAEDAADTVGSSQAVRMSLMDLMDYNMAEEEEDDEAEEQVEEVEEEEEPEVTGGGAEHNCCVCMVRHKGAAFIPCGHTFCRLCSRELMVSRGNCPLCNRFILEILDIF